MLARLQRPSRRRARPRPVPSVGRHRRFPFPPRLSAPSSSPPTPIPGACYLTGDYMRPMIPREEAMPYDLRREYGYKETDGEEDEEEEEDDDDE